MPELSERSGAAQNRSDARQVARAKDQRDLFKGLKSHASSGHVPGNNDLVTGTCSRSVSGLSDQPDSCSSSFDFVSVYEVTARTRPVFYSPCMK